MVDRLSTQYLGQIVQILINLEHFETACQELEQLLVAARSNASAGGTVVLKATEDFRNSKKTAEKRIFELVNSKIDDLIGTAEYDWLVPFIASQSPLIEISHTQRRYILLTLGLGRLQLLRPNPVVTCKP